MILSEGNNVFENNEFSFWSWSAPVLQTPGEVIQKLKELRLEGRVMKDIIAIGMGYNWSDINIDEMICIGHDTLPNDLRDEISIDEAQFSSHLTMNSCAVLDEPLLIKFEDGDVLGISFDEGSCVRMEMNTIPLTIRPGTNRKNFHANRVFRDIIGKPIVEVCVTATIVEPDFTFSHGMELPEQDAYIGQIDLIYDDGSINRPFRRLRFQPELDYGVVELIDYSGAMITVPMPEVRKIVEGFEGEAIFRKQGVV